MYILCCFTIWSTQEESIVIVPLTMTATPMFNHVLSFVLFAKMDILLSYSAMILPPEAQVKGSLHVPAMSVPPVCTRND